MTITTQQARQRFTIIPPSLQDAIFSVQTAEILDNIAQQYHLDDTKAGFVGKITGRVLLGFIHPEDVPGELQKELNLLPKAAQDISKSLDSKIFDTLRSDLKTAYAPVSSVSDDSAVPKILQEIKPPTPTGLSAPVGTAISPKMIAENFKASPVVPLVAPKPPMPAAPKPSAPPAAPAWKPQPVSSQTGAGLNVNATPLASNRNTPGQAPTPPAPAKPPADKGWSRQTSTDPVVKLGVITPSVPKPAAATPTMPAVNPSSNAMPTSTTPAATKPAKNIGEFERLDMMKKAPGQAPVVPSATMPTAPTPTPSPAPIPAPAAPPLPPPVMLHQVSPSSVQQSPEFRINTGLQNQISKTAPTTPPPTKAAVVEFGTASGGNSAPRPPMPAPRPAISSTGPRNVTEVTSSAPVLPPVPPPAPRPAPSPTTPQVPVPPKPQSGKVIVKDFL